MGTEWLTRGAIAIHLPLDGIEQEFYDSRQHKRLRGTGWLDPRNLN